MTREIEMLNMLGLTIGSRVVAIKGDPYGIVIPGDTGTVCHFSDLPRGCNVGIRLDRPGADKGKYHNCFGRCENGRGRYVPADILRLEVCDFGEIKSQDFAIEDLFCTTL